MKPFLRTGVVLSIADVVSDAVAEFEKRQRRGPRRHTRRPYVGNEDNYGQPEGGTNNMPPPGNIRQIPPSPPPGIFRKMHPPGSKSANVDAIPQSPNLPQRPLVLPPEATYKDAVKVYFQSASNIAESAQEKLSEFLKDDAVNILGWHWAPLYRTKRSKPHHYKLRQIDMTTGLYDFVQPKQDCQTVTFYDIAIEITDSRTDPVSRKKNQSFYDHGQVYKIIRNDLSHGRSILRIGFTNAEWDRHDGDQNWGPPAIDFSKDPHTRESPKGFMLKTFFDSIEEAKQSDEAQRPEEESKQSDKAQRPEEESMEINEAQRREVTKDVKLLIAKMQEDDKGNARKEANSNPEEQGSWEGASEEDSETGADVKQKQGVKTPGTADSEVKTDVKLLIAKRQEDATRKATEDQRGWERESTKNDSETDADVSHGQAVKTEGKSISGTGDSQVTTDPKLLFVKLVKEEVNDERLPQRRLPRPVVI